MPVPEALSEINQALSIHADEHEGLRDLARLNIQPETLIEVNKLLAVYDQRIDLLTKAKLGLESLIEDGHPELNSFEVIQTVYQDLQNQQETVSAAFAKFKPIVAANLNLSVETRPKSV